MRGEADAGEGWQVAEDLLGASLSWPGEDGSKGNLVKSSHPHEHDPEGVAAHPKRDGPQMLPGQGKAVRPVMV